MNEILEIGTETEFCLSKVNMMVCMIMTNSKRGDEREREREIYVPTYTFASDFTIGYSLLTAFFKIKHSQLINNNFILLMLSGN